MTERMPDAEFTALGERLHMARHLIGEGRLKQKFYTYFPADGPFRRELYAKQVEFFALGATYSERLFMAANRIGKTDCGAFEVTAHLTGIYPDWWTGRRFYEATEWWACGTNSETTRDVVQAKLLGPHDNPGTGFIPAHLILDTSRRTHGLQGTVESAYIQHSSGKKSTVGFKTYEQGRKSFEGTSKHGIWCLAEGELVQMADGTLRPIECVEVGDDVMSLDCDGQPVRRRVLAAVDQGLRPCVRVIPKHGTPVVCTPDHDVYWGYNRSSKAPAAEASRVAQPYPGAWWPHETDDRSDAWYVWAALIVAEGTVKSRKVTSGDIVSMEKAIALLPPDTKVRRKNYPATTHHVPDWHLSWGVLWSHFEGQRSATKEVPEWVFRSSLPKVTLFLRWLYQGDGWATGHSIGYATTSYRLASQITVLLNRLGVRATMKRRVGAKTQWADQWWVLISKADDALTFLTRVGIEGKQEAVAAVRAEAARRVASVYRRGERLTTHGRREYADRDRRDRLRASKVRSVEDVGERHVYDITVENEHRFLSGTSLVSNCDEEPPADVYQEMLYRTLTTKGMVIVTFTPLQGMSEVVVGYLEPSDIAAEHKTFVQAGWDDVPHLDAAEKKHILASTLPYQVAARTKGEPSLGSGAIYPIAEADISVPTFDVPHTWPKGYGMDVGWNRTAVGFFAREIGTGILYQYDEHYMGQGEPASHAQGIRARGEWLVGVIDPASRGRSLNDGRQLIQSYRDLGLNLDPADNAVEAGLMDVWNLMISGRLKIMARCTRTLAEFRKYHRDEKGNIVKANDHAMDALRYFVRSGRDKMRPQPSTKLERKRPTPDTGGSWMR